MEYDPKKHHRRSVRLKEFDYSGAGVYFVTICTHGRECLLGRIADSEVKLSIVGEIVQRTWHDISRRFGGIRLDAFVVMPNHIHGIIIVNNVGATLAVALNSLCGDPDKRAGTSPAPTLGKIVGAFKSLCFHKCKNNGLNIGKLWQRNYHEHIIRNEMELNSIREYIGNNSLTWHEDSENPDARKPNG